MPSVTLESLHELFTKASLNQQEIIVKTSTSGEGIFSYNREGNTPRTYLQWAKEDLVGRSNRGCVNGIGNAKKSIALLIDQTLDSLNVSVDSKINIRKFISQCSDSFLEGGNTKTKLIASLGVAPSVLISDIWMQRNEIEHGYSNLEPKQVKQAIEVAELLILSVDSREQTAHKIEFLDIEIYNRFKNHKDPFASKPRGIVFDWLYENEKATFSLSYEDKKNVKYSYNFQGDEYEFLLLIKAAFCNTTYDRVIFEHTVTEFLTAALGDNFSVREFDLKIVKADYFE
ncbi:hypothetical protein L2755_03035 [Shewanella abyssi]|uniref:hypothetical protein n=1 Tax=Shewanella abyssi TaxID=311789 RepID=UPI0020101B84|nr:hypothetical protein [Shewanella abyssi]MCL1048611.1 hypothetical protein [Shewanella abyssi]